jgi:hypothetical protein
MKLRQAIKIRKKLREYQDQPLFSVVPPRWGTVQRAAKGSIRCMESLQCRLKYSLRDAELAKWAMSLH